MIVLGVPSQPDSPTTMERLWQLGHAERSRHVDVFASFSSATLVALVWATFSSKHPSGCQLEEDSKDHKKATALEPLFPCPRTGGNWLLELCSGRSTRRAMSRSIASKTATGSRMEAYCVVRAHLATLAPLYR